MSKEIKSFWVYKYLQQFQQLEDFKAANKIDNRAAESLMLDNMDETYKKLTEEETKYVENILCQKKKFTQ